MLAKNAAICYYETTLLNKTKSKKPLQIVIANRQKSGG